MVIMVRVEKKNNKKKLYNGVYENSLQNLSFTELKREVGLQQVSIKFNKQMPHRSSSVSFI